jgi:hypothetical protein
MTNTYDLDHKPVFMNVIQYSIVAHPNTKCSVKSSEFLNPLWVWIVSQFPDGPTILTTLGRGSFSSSLDAEPLISIWQDAISFQLRNDFIERDG